MRPSEPVLHCALQASGRDQQISQWRSWPVTGLDARNWKRKDTRAKSWLQECLFYLLGRLFMVFSAIKLMCSDNSRLSHSRRGGIWYFWVGWGRTWWSIALAVFVCSTIQTFFSGVFEAFWVIHWIVDVMWPPLPDSYATTGSRHRFQVTNLTLSLQSNAVPCGKTAVTLPWKD